MKRKRYCFRSEADQQALLAEAGLRGFHAAVLDFPGQKTPEQQQLMAEQDGHVLAGEVCCTPDARAYTRLVVASWMAFYTAMPEAVGERLMASAKMHIKPMSEANGLLFLRQLLTDQGMKEVLDDLYRRYQNGIKQLSATPPG